jgi:hypothetical protein
MPFLTRFARSGALAVALLGLAALRPASAQEAITLSRTAPRVLSDITDTIKDDDGTRVTLRTVLEYNPASGEYVRTVTEENGTVRDRTVRTSQMARPTPAENDAAQTLIGLDPEISTLIARAQNPVEILGGFQLVREEGHGCGPGSRCLQYEVIEVVPGEAFGRRMRYVVVDLQNLQLFSNNFDPAAEGNLANPAAREQSRSR